MATKRRCIDSFSALSEVSRMEYEVFGVCPVLLLLSCESSHSFCSFFSAETHDPGAFSHPGCFVLDRRR